MKGLSTEKKFQISFADHCNEIGKRDKKIAKLEAENKRLHSVVDPLIVETHDAQEQRDRLAEALEIAEDFLKCHWDMNSVPLNKITEAIASLQADNQQQDEQQSGNR